MHGKKGFTLMEMLIVVAIIAILTAIAIPVFSTQLTKARASACAANRRSLLAEIKAAQMSDEKYLSMDSAGLLNKFNTGGKYSCPKNGTFSLVRDEDGYVTAVTCTVHKTEASNSLGSADNMKAIMQTLSKNATNTVDSGAAKLSDSISTHADSALKALKEAGFDLNSMGAKSWQYSKRSSFLYWSDVDISSNDNLSQSNGSYVVPTIRYSEKDGSYTVWIATVSADGHTELVKDKTYNFFKNYAEYTDSTQKDQGNQTYAQAQIRYQEALKKYGYTS